MSMRKNIDELFRQKLGSTRDIPFNGDSWQKMEALLDEKMPIASGNSVDAGGLFIKTAAGKWLVAASVSAIALLGVWSIYTWQNNNKQLASTPPNEATTSALKSNDQSTESAQVLTEAEENESSIEQGSSVNGSITESEQTSLIQEEPNSDIQNTNNTESFSTISGSAAKISNSTSTGAGSGIEENNTTLVFPGSSAAQSVYIAPGDVDESINRRKLLTAITIPSLKDDKAFLPLASSTRPIGERPIFKRNRLFVTGGASITQRSGKNAVSFSGNELIGFGIERIMPGGWTLGANMIYAPTNTVEASRSFESVYYNFGKHLQTTTITSNRLYYLEMPIYAKFSMGRHQVLGGLAPAYLMQVRSNVSDRIVSPFDETMQEDEAMGYVNGFNNWDIALTAGYEFQVHQRLSAGARASYGLTDITKNSFYQTDDVDRNVQLRVLLTYQLFDF